MSDCNKQGCFWGGGGSFSGSQSLGSVRQVQHTKPLFAYFSSRVFVNQQKCTSPTACWQVQVQTRAYARQQLSSHCSRCSTGFPIRHSWRRQLETSKQLEVAQSHSKYLGLQIQVYLTSSLKHLIPLIHNVNLFAVQFTSTTSSSTPAKFI